MSGGKGGSSSTEIPEWLKDPLLRNITRAEAIQSQEYQPWQGADVAAFTPMQVQAMQNVGGAAEAFGMAPMNQGSTMATQGIMPATEYGGGIRGYSSYPLYQQQQQAAAATPAGQANLQIRSQLYSPEVQQTAVERFKNQFQSDDGVIVTPTADDDGDHGDDGGFGGRT